MVDVQSSGSGAMNKRLFTACFIALVATSFAFMVRSMLIGEWQVAFGLTETQKGQILGAGLWSFGISIVLFSLIIDKIGYKTSMVFAFICHVLSVIILVTAKGYTGLYIGSFFNGLAAGIVEAVINPAVATMYPKEKTKMLTILHAGWPGGMVIGGILIFTLGGATWQTKVLVILLPVILYGIWLVKCKFPVSERVTAGVSYRDMLKEAGALGCLIVAYMIIIQINDILPNVGFLQKIDMGSGFALPCIPFTIIMVGLTVVYFIYTKSFGRWMYIFLLVVMILLAITELGTDAWIKELMGPSMASIGLKEAGWVLVYTALIMVVLRLFAIGPLIKIFNPLWILMLSSLFAAVGLFWLAKVSGIWILIMATIYGTGQCFFWPVTLGLVSERFPKGGALTLNAIAGVGMLGVGILGSVLLGYWQDTKIERTLRPDTALYQKVMAEKEKSSVFGNYKPIDGSKENEINDKVGLYAYQQGKEGEELAKDKKYQTLVRNAYTHMGHKEVKSHQEMEQTLKDKGFFVKADEYNSLTKDKGKIDSARADAKKNTMANIAILPLIMAVCYLFLIIYFKYKGGYQAIELKAKKS